jgi:menaquinone-dependent protoporphyrinogen oxidase
MTKALIVYGTRYGATASTSEDVAEVFRQEGLDADLINLKDDKVKDINEYELVIVGSGIQIGKWTKEPEKFLYKYQKELAKKKTALFVCCGSTEPLDEKEDKNVSIENARTKYLEEKAAKYNLQPIALGLFGGVYNFNKMSWFFRKTMSGLKSKLEEAGFKETEPGLYDLRDSNAINIWAKEVAKLALT